MTNQEQIQARIARDKQRRAAKRYAKAHGLWRESKTIDKGALIAAVNDRIRHKWHSRVVQKIEEMNQKLSAETRLKRISPLGEHGWVFTIQHLLQSLLRRRKDVTWKGNVQRYLFHALIKLKMAKEALLSGKLDINETIRTIMLMERGKIRIVHAVMIDFRVIQGTFCDSSLVPLVEDSLIYDNPASIKGRGVHQGRQRLELFLREMARKHGNNFWVDVGDLTKFFDSIRHVDCYEIMKHIEMDRMLQGLGMKIARIYQEHDLKKTCNKDRYEAEMKRLKHMGGVGMTLGSQVSQVMAVAVPNSLDHAIKDKLGIRPYERYMDDTISAHATKAEAWAAHAVKVEEAEKLGLKMNPKKTKVAKASRGFKFMQVMYRVTDTARLVKTLAKAGIIRMRRKLKKFAGLIRAGKMTKDQAFESFSSWLGNSYHAAAYRQRKTMLTLFNKLFRGYRVKGVYA